MGTMHFLDQLEKQSTHLLFYTSGKFDDELTKELKHTGAGVVSMVFYYNVKVVFVVLIFLLNRQMQDRTPMAVSFSSH